MFFYTCFLNSFLVFATPEKMQKAMTTKTLSAKAKQEQLVQICSKSEERKKSYYLQQNWIVKGMESHKDDNL